VTGSLKNSTGGLGSGSQCIEDELLVDIFGAKTCDSSGTGIGGGFGTDTFGVKTSDSSGTWITCTVGFGTVSLLFMRDFGTGIDSGFGTDICDEAGAGIDVEELLDGSWEIGVGSGTTSILSSFRETCIMGNLLRSGARAARAWLSVSFCSRKGAAPVSHVSSLPVSQCSGQ